MVDYHLDIADAGSFASGIFVLNTVNVNSNCKLKFTWFAKRHQVDSMFNAWKMQVIPCKTYSAVPQC